MEPLLCYEQFKAFPIYNLSCRFNTCCAIKHRLGASAWRVGGGRGGGGGFAAACHAAARAECHAAASLVAAWARAARVGTALITVPAIGTALAIIGMAETAWRNWHGNNWHNGHHITAMM